LWTEPNFVPIICLGMVSTDDRVRLRKKVSEFQQYLLGDVLFNSIYSVRQPGWYLHASQDHFEITLKMIEFLRALKGFRFHAVIGRKDPEIFLRKHNGNSTEFYFDLIHKLLALQPLSEGANYRLFLSQRHGSNSHRFTQAFEKILTAESTSRTIVYNCAVVPSQSFPELSVVDYLLWVLQRYILTGDRRYFGALSHHYEQILDLYEDDGKGRLYTKENQFLLEQASPFDIGVKK
jgi:hypothetical protein